MENYSIIPDRSCFVKNYERFMKVEFRSAADRIVLTPMKVLLPAPAVTPKDDKLDNYGERAVGINRE